jgi:hypothetical protein
VSKTYHFLKKLLSLINNPSLISRLSLYDVEKKSLSNVIKIRVSNCNLNIEKGRYLKLPVEQRICQLCHMDVEDEFHFLMNCDKLIHERVISFVSLNDLLDTYYLHLI